MHVPNLIFQTVEVKYSSSPHNLQTSSCDLIDHFTVVVTWPKNGSKAAGDPALIQPLYFSNVYVD